MLLPWATIEVERILERFGFEAQAVVSGLFFKFSSGDSMRTQNLVSIILNRQHRPLASKRGVWSIVQSRKASAHRRLQMKFVQKRSAMHSHTHIVRTVFRFTFANPGPIETQMNSRPQEISNSKALTLNLEDTLLPFFKALETPVCLSSVRHFMMNDDRCQVD